MFELIARDAAGRIGKWFLGKHKIDTPNICIVINPNKITIPIDQLKKDFKAQIIITNSYIIKRSKLSAEAIEKGVHKLIGWQGPIYTDSGTFQMYSQKAFDIKPEEILEYQIKIKSDIITPLDVFTFPDDDFKTARKKLSETISRIKRARELVPHLAAPIQGGRHLSLRAKACKSATKLDPELFAIGGIVPYMEQYRFKELIDIILTCKASLAPNKPLHAFGAGHPMLFALLTAFGCDIFDSAMYSLAAERDAYLTVNGSFKLDELKEFPCSCPLCARSEPEQIKLLDCRQRVAWLAKHNLYVTFEELRAIKTAIRENSLWELVQIRARAHPAILEALRFGLKKYSRFLLKLDLVSKRSAFMWGGDESKFRPEVLRAKVWAKRISSKRKFNKKPFGKIPLELKNAYPFGQSIVPEFKDIKAKISSQKEAFAIINYQYGRNASKNFKGSYIEVSRRTHRLRRIWKEGKLLGTFRPYDHFFLPTLLGASMLPIKKADVIDPEAAKFISKGRAVFAKFVKPLDEIHPGEEVAIVHKNKIIAVGKALLNSAEMRVMDRGVAIEIRAHL